jgi:hypothetical protein
MENFSDLFELTEELRSDKQLNEKDLLVDPVEIPAKKSHPIDAGDLTFSVGAAATASVQLFNDENDKDADELLALKDGVLSFNPKKEAILKYRMTVGAKANASVSREDLGFEFDADTELISACYRNHKPTDIIKASVAQDLLQFPTIFKWRDVETLSAGDALSFLMTGKLTASLKVSWSNIFSQSLSGITSFLPVPVTLDLNLTPSFSASFAVEVKDSFCYVIRRVDEDRCFVAISKSKSSRKTGALGVSVGIKFADEKEADKQLAGLVDQILQAIFKKSTAEIDAAVKAVQSGSTKSKEVNTVSEVAALLEVAGLPNYIDVLAEKYDALKKKLASVIKTIAMVNAELSFAYEYERIREGKEILSLTLPVKSLKKYHPGLLKFKNAAILEDLRAEKIAGVESINYLNQSRLEIKKTWGFGLKVFDTTVLNSRDFDHQEDQVRTNFEGRKLISLKRSTGYNWKLGKAGGKWLGECSTGMKTFSAGREPLMSEMDTKLYLHAAIQDPKSKGNDFEEYLDLGVLWQAVRQTDVASFADKYKPTLKRESALYESKLVFSELATLTVLTQCGQNGFNKTNQRLMAKALAAAMPYWNVSPARMEVATREKIYESLWLDYLTNPQQSTRELAIKAHGVLSRMDGLGSLPNLERQGGLSNAGMVFADVVFLHPNLYQDVLSFFKGAAIISNAMVSNAPLSDHFHQAYKSMKPIFTQSLYVRAIGHLLLAYVNANPLLAREVSRVFTVTFGAGEEEQVINFAIIQK